MKFYSFRHIAFLSCLFFRSFVSGGSDDDWTKCPTGCFCSWTSGKRTANCERQGLNSLPKFLYPDKIQVLILNHNSLLALKERAFESTGLINLQKVYLQNCSIAYLDPTAFLGLVIMIELDLSWNRLTSIQSNTFRGNIRIRKLWLSHNPIRSLNFFEFPSLPHLRILDLSHCRLSHLNPRTFRNLASVLEVLHLNDNRFRRLNRSTFVAHQGRLKSLTLERNPWNCNCRLRKFWEWLMSNNLFSLPTSCSEPKKLRGKTWDELDIESLACSPRVKILEPMVTVSSGQTAQLACLVDQNPNAKVYWVRSGVIISNNSLSSLEDENGGERQFYSLRLGSAKGFKDTLKFGDGESFIKTTWLNLTIRNVQHSGAGGYTCVARNEGGMAEGNVTLVYSESVMSYLDDPEISVLLVTGAAAGTVVFFLVGGAVILVMVEKRKRQRENLLFVRHSPAAFAAIKKNNSSEEVSAEKDKHISAAGQVNISLLQEEELEEGVDDSRSNSKKTEDSRLLYHQKIQMDEESKPGSASSSSQYQDDSGCGDSQTTTSGSCYAPNPPPPDLLETSYYPSRPPSEEIFKKRESSLLERIWDKSSGSRLFESSAESLDSVKTVVPIRKNNGYSLSRYDNSGRRDHAGKEAIILQLRGDENRRRHGYNSRSNLLLEEYESRKELLEALVKDKNDTVV